MQKVVQRLSPYKMLEIQPEVCQRSGDLVRRGSNIDRTLLRTGKPFRERSYQA